MDEGDFPVVCGDASIALLLLEPSDGPEAPYTLELRTPDIQGLVAHGVIFARARWGDHGEVCSLYPGRTRSLV
jgi:hypothetical protein